MKDAQGNTLTTKEYIERWKGGIQKITPLQQMQTQLWGYWIVLAGIVWGLVMTGIAKTWWLFTILIGSLIISSTTFLGVYQKYSIFKKIEQESKGGIINDKEF